MPTILQTDQGTVTGLWGRAIIKGADGRARPLKLGDLVRRGDVILTSQDGIVQLTSEEVRTQPAATQAVADTPLKSTPADAPPTAAATDGDVDRVIANLARNDTDAAPAAGLTPGDGGEFLPGLRVERISETLTALGLGNGEALPDRLPDVIAIPAAVLANIAPSAIDAAVIGTENTTLPVSLQGVDSDGNVVSVTVTTVPANGTLLLADGSTLVSAGQTLTPTQAAGLQFKPALDFVGQVAITFFVTDNQGAISNDATVSLNLLSTTPQPNQPPVAVNDIAVTPEETPASGNVLSNDSDPDNNSLTVTQFSIAGTTYVAGSTAVLAGVGSLTLTANGTYNFVPEVNYNGPVPVATYTVSDGTASVTATLTLTVTPVPDPAVIGGTDTGATVEDTTLSATGTLTIADPDAGEVAFNPLTQVAGAHGTFSITAAGVWTYTLNNTDPAVQALGQGQSLPNETFTVTSIDGTSHTVTVSITGTNDAPLAQNASLAATEDAPVLSGQLLATDVDANAGLSFSLNSAPPAGLILNPNGSYTFDPANAAYQSLAAGQKLVLSVPYTVTDEHGATSPAILTITVTGTNDAAVVAGVATGSVTEDGTALAQGNLTVTDVDSPATFVATTATGTYGNFVIDAAGSWTYTLRNADANVQALTSAQHPQETFTVTTADGTTSTVTITVNGANEPPLAVVTPASGNEDSSGIPVLLGGSDIDGSVAGFTIGSLPANGTLLFNGVPVSVGQSIPASSGSATLSFVPAANFNGSTAFDFTATDNEGATSPVATVPIVVTPVADPAVIGGTDSGATVEDTTLSASGQLTISDPDTGEAAFNPLANVAGAHGTFSIDASGAWTYSLNNADPAVQALGQGQSLPNETFTVTSIDGTSHVVSVSITGTNDAPQAQDASLAATEDAPVLSGQLLATDADANAVLSFSLNSAPPPGLILNPNGSYTFDPAHAAYQSLAAGQKLVVSVPYTVTDDQGATSTATLTITVTGTNDAPVAVDDQAATPINTPLASINVLGNDTDVDGGPLTVSAASLANPALGTIAINPDGTLAFTPASNVTGPVVVNYTVSDGQGGFSNAVLTINVGANTPPAGSDAALVIAEDSSRSFSAADFGYSDADAGQSFAQVRIDTLPVAGTLQLNGVAVTAGQVVAVTDLGQLVYTPAPNANGASYAGFDFSVQDSAGAFDPTPNHFSIAVTPVNDAPVASGSATLAPISEDTANPTGASVGSLFAGNFSDATDQVAGGSSANTLAGVAISNYTVDASKGVWQYSTDGGAHWTALPAGSVNAAVTLVVTDWLRFLPAANYNGAATALAANLIESGGAAISSGATVDLSAGTGASSVYSANTVALNETITPVNDPPVAVNDHYTTLEDQPLTIPLSSLLANDSDVDGDALTVIAAQTTAGGTLSLVNGNLVFTPNPNYFGPASFQYTISDGHGGTASATVNIDVTPVNDAPVNSLPASPYAATEDTRVAITGVSVSDPDEAGGIAAQKLASVQLEVGFGTLRVALVGSASITAGAVDSNTLTLSGTQADINSTLASLSYQGNANFNGNDTLKVHSVDASGLVDDDTMTIAVAAVNDPPVAVNDHFTTPEDQPLTIPLSSLLANDSDVDGDALTVIAAQTTAGGTLSIVSGNLVFTPNPNYFGPASFQYTISDGHGGTASATVNIDVTPVNDAPVARNDEGSVTASQALVVTAAEGVIQSTSTPAGRDTDVDGDTLSVIKVTAGSGAPVTDVPSGGVTIAGTYGDLLLRSDGSYTYTANRADAVATGTQVNDVFTYQVSDGHGGFATAALTLHVNGTADTLNSAPPTTTALTATLGLNGEYYGYNDFNPGPTSPNRRHSDDGVYGNLDRASDVSSIVNGRNAAFGGGAVAGTSTAAATNAADAHFLARNVDYGTTPAVTNSLGTNPNIAPGGSTASLNNGNSQLYKFLNHNDSGDATTLTVAQGTADNDANGGGPTSGLGRTSDAAIRLTGEAYLAAGLYDIRVYADDGFRLKLHDQTVAVFDDIQSPTTRVYTGVPIEGGLTPLELLYWEQGGNAVLRVEFKLSGTADSTYQVLGSQNMPLFSEANAPVLSDLQDLVPGSTPGSYLIRTGSQLDGGNGDDTLTGSAARDVLIGGQGKDTLNGGAGDDLIRGGAGNDQLTGGAGHDVFRWSLGDAGTTGAPARDVITDFDNTPHSGDVLDLRDLLVGESHAANTVSLPSSIGLNNALTVTPHEGNLANYLHFSAVGGNTVIEISSTGGFTGGSYTPAAVDQVITLTGLNLVGGFSNDHQVINDLLQRGKLVTD